MRPARLDKINADSIRRLTVRSVCFLDLLICLKAAKYNFHVNLLRRGHKHLDSVNNSRHARSKSSLLLHSSLSMCRTIRPRWSWIERAAPKNNVSIKPVGFVSFRKARTRGSNSTGSPIYFRIGVPQDHHKTIIWWYTSNCDAINANRCMTFRFALWSSVCGNMNETWSGQDLRQMATWKTER